MLTLESKHNLWMHLCDIYDFDRIKVNSDYNEIIIDPEINDETILKIIGNKG